MTTPQTTRETSRTRPAHRGTSPQRSDSAESGSALIETVFGVTVVLVPLIWLALALLRVEAGAYAVRAAARESARTYVTAPTSAQGAARAQLAGQIAFEDQDVPIGRVQMQCSASPCLTPGATVHTHATTDVRLPFVPQWVVAGTGLSVRVSAEHSETVEQYGGQR